MPYVLTTASSITCAGTGTVSTSGQAKLKVSNAPVLRLDGISGKLIAGCKTPTNSSSKTCRAVASASGEAVKLKVSGAAAALDNLTGTGDGTKGGTPEALSVSANQTKLMAT